MHQQAFFFSHFDMVSGWDAFHLSEVLLTQPIMVVIGDIPGGFGAYRDGHKIIERARLQKKELVELKNSQHYDLYYKPEATKPALERIIPFLRSNI